MAPYFHNLIIFHKIITNPPRNVPRARSFFVRECIIPHCAETLDFGDTICYNDLYVILEVCHLARTREIRHYGLQSLIPRG